MKAVQFISSVRCQLSGQANLHCAGMGWLSNGKCHSTKRLDGKVVIVTGSNTGIGRYTALDLARRGAEVIMACRDLEKAEAAAGGIRKRVPEANLKVMRLDLSSLESVRSFCKDFLASYDNLHLLINNAGVMLSPWKLSEDGFEIHFATNHLGHFLLTMLLLPTICKSAPSRIINVSSMVHRICASMSYEDLNNEKLYSPTGAYARSKVANVLFTKELARRLKGTEVTAVSLHPGVVNTEIPRHLNDLYFPGAYWLYSKMGWWLMKSPKQGAQTTLYCALEDCVESGLYYDDCAVLESSPMSNDPNVAKELWDKSLEWVKLGNDYQLPLQHNDN
ncbi:retinol dehydrogenase 11 [Halyomorpha halys]|uniref:retinol dehydrogenase 11 n=1 Tax=Halyomorpha halys TaxID=286706 RepID=UPI0006D4F2FC|nr:retinol dehydrogenase 11 [Halyomorpha halys]